MGIQAVTLCPMPGEGEWKGIIADAGNVIVTSDIKVPNYGTLNVAMMIDTCAFGEIARAMIEADPTRAERAFRMASGEPASPVATRPPPAAERPVAVSTVHPAGAPYGPLPSPIFSRRL